MAAVRVSKLMNVRAGWLWLVGVVVIGCTPSGPKVEAPKPAEASEPVASNEATKPSPAVPEALPNTTGVPPNPKPGTPPSAPNLLDPGQREAIVPKLSPEQAARRDKLLKIDRKATKALAPELVAKAADTALQTASRISGDSNALFESGQGTGRDKSKIQILDGRRYRIEYPFMERVPRDLDQQTLMADGRVATVFSNTGWRPQGDPKTRKSSAVDLKNWPLHFARDLFSAVGTKETPLQNLVKVAKSKGMKVIGDEKTVTSKGKKFRMRRIVISGKSPSEPNIEIVTDAVRGYPITVRTETKAGPLATKGIPTRTVWSVYWRFGTDAIIDTSRFAIPAEGLTGTKS